MQIKKEWNNTRKSLLKIFFMSLFLVCICTLSVPGKSLAQETTDSATYAGSTSVKAYVTGNSENEQENNSKEEGALQDSNTTSAKTGDESKVIFWIIIWILSMIVFCCGLKYKNSNKKIKIYGMIESKNERKEEVQKTKGVRKNERE